MTKNKPVLSPAVSESFAHFLSCHQPKHFSRYLRSMMLEVVLAQEGNYTLYMQPLFESMEMFFEVLDIAEDEAC